MTSYISKLTVKNQTTVPKEVREVLHLHAHDQIAYEILSDNTVVIRKVTPLDAEYLKSLNYTLSEWDSDDDDDAFRHL